MLKVQEIFKFFFMQKTKNALILFLSAMFFLTTLPAGANDYQARINVKSRTLQLLNGGKIIKTYKVGVGKPQFPTPVGNFKVISKKINTGWENPYKRKNGSRINPGRGNPLGTRWIGFYRVNKGEYGIHGTNNPSSVGKFSSHGCVRMRIKDAEELFEKLTIGSTVIIQNI